MGSQYSDEQLVELASQGGQAAIDAFDTLVDRYQDRVFNLLVRMSGSEEDAEDLAQKSFVSAWKALASFQKGSRFYTWLYRIALNAVFSHERDKARKRKHEAGSLDAPLGGSGGSGGTGRSGGSRGSRGGDRGSGSESASFGAGLADRRSPDPLAALLEKERGEQIQQALNDIEPDYRVILVLRDMDDLDYETIADTLAISLAAVKSRLHRARKEMARLLKDM